MLLCGCAGGPPPADWQLESHAAAQAFERAYLRGDSRVAEVEFARLKKEFSATGRLDLEARAELLRCALRAASLEFDDCPGFEKLRAYAGPEELAYADFLSGKTTRSESDDALGRLVNFGVRFRTGTTNPSEIKAAGDLSSEQGWRRPLLAWLGVEAKRAEAAGDRDTLERIRRRMAFVSGTYK
ncbi:MAG: hypothetical protein IT513_14555 [Burkholderiales bacterium]|nr:hypothetical protein [Burkholderiales bacterium]